MGTEVEPKSEEAVPAEAPTNMETKIIRQIEYYFGNYNLSRDKFLKEQLSVDNGWIPLEVLIKFNRLKKLTEDFTVITDALKKSTKQIIEISEDSQKIRRRTEVISPPEDSTERQEEFDGRTLYVKGFKKTNTLDELLDFFYEHNVAHVYMRRHPHQKNKPFKGSVFATFETKEDAAKFLETKGIKYNGVELLKEWKVDYVKRKDELYAKFKVEKEQKLLKKAEKAKEDKKNGCKAAELDMIPGCLLKLTNLDKDTTRECIKEFFDEYGTLVYIDYFRGKPSAVLRFDSGVASTVLEKMPEEDGERKAKLSSCTAVVTSIEGEEEKEYWENIAISRAQTREKFRGNKNFGNKNFGNKGRFKQWGKRPKGRNNDNEKDDEDDQPTQKRAKVEKSEDTEEPTMKRGKTEKSEEDTEKPTQKRAKDDKSEDTEEPTRKKAKVEKSEESTTVKASSETKAKEES